MSKFKKGDKVIRVYSDWNGMNVGDTATVEECDDTCVKLKEYNEGGHDPHMLKLAPIKNTIITDIKDETQHKRVQEKLFSMGHRWINGKSTVQNYGSGVRNMIAIGNKDMFQSPINESSYDHISANEFLSETKTAREIINKYYPSYREYKWKMKNREPLIEQFKKFNYNTPTTLSSAKGKNIMNTEQSFPCGVAAAGKSIVSFAKDLLLSSDEKLLRKYGLHDEYGKNTNDARELIMNKFLNSPENQAYLLEVAEAKQADEKANK